MPLPRDEREPRETAFARLVDEQGGRLYALGLRFCGDPEQAEDLVQETFLLAYRHWDDFEGRSSVATWLYTIASRVCSRFHRKRVGEPDHMTSLDDLMPSREGPMGVVPADDDPLAASIRTEARAQVEKAISDLPLAFRMPLVLKEIAGLSLVEVARIMELEPATVKTRLHRARLKLRKALEAPLPQRDVPSQVYSRRICLDLLQAKQDSLDHGDDFAFPEGVVSERCSEIFATLDLAQSLCRDFARGQLPEDVRQELLARLAAENAPADPAP